MEEFGALKIFEPIVWHSGGHEYGALVSVFRILVPVGVLGALSSHKCGRNLLMNGLFPEQGTDQIYASQRGPFCIMSEVNLL